MKAVVERTAGALVMVGFWGLVIFLLLTFLTACEPQNERDCKSAGGTWQKTGSHSYRCVPPRGGWQ